MCLCWGRRKRRAPLASSRCRVYLTQMTLHKSLPKHEVGVREPHDQLSRYIHHAAQGGEVIVTMRGKRVARLVPVREGDPLADLRARGLVRDPTQSKRSTAGASNFGRLSQCPTWSPSNAADRLLRYIGSDQAHICRAGIRPRPRALAPSWPRCIESARIPRGTRRGSTSLSYGSNRNKHAA
jgi:prevent-host-death family protein